MHLYVLDNTLTVVAVIDSFKSLIWTTRYFECGDFELFLPADPDLLQYLQEDYFIIRDDDSSVMVIEDCEIQTDAENGDFFIVTGRSLESILLRRVFCRQFNLTSSGSLAFAVWALVQECQIVRNPTTGEPTGATYRQIPNLDIDMNFPGTETITAQFTGQTLFEAIQLMIQQRSTGIRMVITATKKMQIQLYKGTEVPVTFSPEYDNILSSKYTFSKRNFANTVVCAGEGEGTDRQITTVIRGTFANRPSGLKLREIWVDARDISSNNGSIDGYTYSRMLSERANEKMAEHCIEESFEAQIEPNTTYKYKTDYNLGDIVTVENGYGVTSKPRIVEIIESWDETGYTVVPTFDTLAV